MKARDGVGAVGVLLGGVAVGSQLFVGRPIWLILWLGIAAVLAGVWLIVEEPA